MRILFDADSVMYKIGSACDNRHYLLLGKRYDSKVEANIMAHKKGEPEENIQLAIDPESEEKVISTLLPFIEEKIALAPEGDTTLFIGSPGNFRNNVATMSTYKGTRDRSLIPTHMDLIRETIINNYDVNVARPELEADDEISIEARDPKTECVILSIDKDLLQIPGAHINFDTGEEQITDGFQGFKLLASQMLTGDTSDNVKGLSGVGPKSAHVKKIINATTMEEIWEVLLTLYQKYFGYYAFQFMRENYMLLRLVGEPTVYEVYMMNMLNINAKGYWRNYD